MLEITIPGLEYFDEEASEFIYYDDATIQLEHSLVSISKWESKWCKPFLDGKNKTLEEILDYVHCMCIDEKTDKSLVSVFKYLSSMTSKPFFNKSSYFHLLYGFNQSSTSSPAPVNSST